MAYKGAALTTNQFLQKDDYLLSASGGYMLYLQDDGNLVLYRLRDHVSLWNSDTEGKAVTKAIMQQDGNFVVYGYSGSIYTSNTDGHPNSMIILQDDGNLVIYEPKTPIWATGVDAGN